MMKHLNLFDAITLFTFVTICHLIPSVRCDNELTEEQRQQIEEEWEHMSASGTRKVYNFGIASLTSWGGRQHTQEHETMPRRPSLVTPAYIGRAEGIRRSFELCAAGRYMAAMAIPCNDDVDDDDCPPILGVYFEVRKEDYPNLRKREIDYGHIEITPGIPVPVDLDPNGYYFAWGSASSSSSSSSSKSCGKDQNISQAYWDITIGGILAWDGQLLDTNRYTWSLDAELELGSLNMKDKVHSSPSISLIERRKKAVELVKSTKKSSNHKWMDDRKCPFTYNSIITPSKSLHYDETNDEEMKVFGQSSSALGTVSPMATQKFYDYVDEILIEGGWDPAEGRTDPCPKSSSILLDRLKNDNHGNGWGGNRYYKDMQRWVNNNSFSFDSN